VRYTLTLTNRSHGVRNNSRVKTAPAAVENERPVVRCVEGIPVLWRHRPPNSSVNLQPMALEHDANQSEKS
jgi:hypothetical protein